MEYSATATGAPVGNKQTYYINCKDKAKNICDADLDSRYFWVFETNGNNLTVSGNGVAKDKKSDPTAKVEKRFQFDFSKVNE